MDKRSFLISGSALLLAGCSSVTVNQDYDRGFNFSGLKTFAWNHETQPQTGLPRIDNDLNDRRIRRAVEANLQAKGFQKVDKVQADFLVEYFMSFQQRIDSSGGSVSFGMGRSTAGRAGSVGISSGGTVSDYEEAQLTIDILDVKSEQMIWRGRGRRRTSNTTDPAKIESRTNDAVMRILKKFPPKR